MTPRIDQTVSLLAGAKHRGAFDSAQGKACVLGMRGRPFLSYDNFSGAPAAVSELPVCATHRFAYRSILTMAGPAIFRPGHRFLKRQIYTVFVGGAVAIAAVTYGGYKGYSWLTAPAPQLQHPAEAAGENQTS